MIYFWIAAALLVVALIYVYRSWLSHEQSRQDQERRRLDRVMKANEPPYRAQRAAGFNSKRVG